MLQAPVVIEPRQFSTQLGGDCNSLVPFVVGAAAMFVLPPLLAGMIQGARDEYREQRGKRR